MLLQLIGGFFMLNIIWPIFILISFAFAIITGEVNSVTNSIFDSSKNAIDLSISLLGIMCLWCGIIKIAMNTKIIDKLIKFLQPILKILFPEINEDEEVQKEISMNIIANMLGLGNAATPLGLKAMQSMQRINKNKKELSNSMGIFIVLNTASIQIIPTTVIAIRNSLNSNNPTKMIAPIWISTCCAAISAITAAKILSKKW